MEITSSVVLPVTQIQLNEFSEWVSNTYRTYDQFMSAIKSAEVDNYIKTNILPEEMTHALRISDRYAGEKWGGSQIQAMLLDRRRVTAKMKNLKEKIAKQTFPIESTQSRKTKTAAAQSRREEREAVELKLQSDKIEYNMNVMKSKFTKIQQIEKDCDMDDDCAICLSLHKMSATCTIGCGHQFGLMCLVNWKKETCPLCRTQIVETTGFVKIE